MKQRTGLSLFLLIITTITLLFIGCTGGGAGGSSGSYTPQPSLDGTETSDFLIKEVYLDIANSRLVNATVGMEYSLNDRTAWTQCPGSSPTIALIAGNRVWIRETDETTTETFLGEVISFSGPDLYPGDHLYIGTGSWSDIGSASPGDVLDIYAYMKNIGTTNGYSSGHQIRFYLSTDETITADDTLLVDLNYDYTCPIGDVYIGSGPETTFTVPSVTAGTYYIGCIVDATNVITEMNEDNNVTRPEAVTPLVIKDTSAVPSGAVKIYNSWGAGSWENKSDGWYWMPYEVLKANNMRINYYYNDFTQSYNPTVVLEFALSHPRRNECRISIGLGDPVDPYRETLFQSEWSASNILSGAQPFPSNDMVLDISEFASALNSYDLYLKIENSGSTTGSLTKMNLELYSSYPGSQIKILNSLSSSLPASLPAGETIIYLSSAGNLTLIEQEQILPMSRSVTSSGLTFNERLLSSTEINEYINRFGAYEPGKNYNQIINGKYGTGDAPPTRESLEKTKLLESVESTSLRGTLPSSWDNSESIYFPPTGNQGSEGSCAAYSFGYYIQTYTEAREHGWDLSSTGWTGAWPGYPDSNLDKIFSPDFIYHLINSGEDNGSNSIQAASLIIRIGGAPWNLMPYDTSDSTSWPSEAAWRAAPLYRGRETGKYYWDDLPSGFFVIEDDSDIQLLKSLLAAGYCLSTAIEASPVYDALDSADVVNPNLVWASTDHAQTIVGYKESSAWDPANPDL
jgi:CARDB